MTRSCSIALAACLSISCLFGSKASAAPETDADAAARSPDGGYETAERYGLSPLLMLGWSDGLAAGGQWDVGVFGLRASAGYNVIPIIVDVDGDRLTNDSEFEALGGFQLNADALALPIRTGKFARVGLSAGYRFNSVLQHGGALGFQGEAELSSNLTLLFQVVLALYPDGESRARDELAYGPEADFNFPFGAGFQSGAGIGLKFGP